MINFKVPKKTTIKTTNTVQTCLNLWAHTRPLSVRHSTACQQMCLYAVLGPLSTKYVTHVYSKYISQTIEYQGV